MRDLFWTIGKIKLITHLCCRFSTLLGSLSQEILYCHLNCNKKYYFSSSEANLGPYQIFMMELFCENIKELEGANRFRRKIPLYFPVKFEKFLRTTFSKVHIQ